MQYTPLELSEFKQIVWHYYRTHGRVLPWRQPDADNTFDPYKILVSEIMLQQTQVTRVIPKYDAFIAAFPTLNDLAQAKQSEVIRQWSGLGYNRRAKFLHQTAQLLEERGGQLPVSLPELVTLPGIGGNTAGAILAYAFNQPAVFLETNIRTVFIYHFFHERIAVRDEAIRELVLLTLDTERPREWYWSLMDYGVWLKNTVGNTARQSHGYKKQSTFEGSYRQIRGQVLRYLIDQPQTLDKLQLVITDPRLTDVLDELLAERLITHASALYRLAD